VSKPKGSMWVLYIHGIGDPEKGYSKQAERIMSASLSKRGWAMYAREVLYGPLFDMAADKFLADTEAHGSKGNMSQKLSIKTLADALQFQSNSKLREQICHVVDYEFLKLRAPDEVVIIAHSLGNMVALEWLRTRQAVKKATLVSLACNVGIFTMGQSLDVPSQLRRPGSWINVFSDSDALGWPMRVIPEARDYVIDVRTEVDGFLSWTGLAHVGYWESKALHRDTLPNLLCAY
jgi:hypothetical protein